MRFFDLTRIIEPGMAVYPGDSHPAFVSQSDGDVRITGLHFCTHTGTHIDAPSHYLKSGATIDRIPPGHGIGDCTVLDCTSFHGGLALHHFEGQVDGVQRLLIKTAPSGISGFDPQYTSLAPDAARYLIAAGVRCIGTDAPSIEKYQGDGTVHRILLSAGLLIIEWLDLSSVPAGKYRMIALPLRLGGLDGSPARVVLWVP